MKKIKNMNRIRLLGLYASSCAAALLLVVLTRGEGRGYEYLPPSRSFAVAECPVSVSDREAAGALSEAGIQGVVSESTQFFLLSAWNGVEQAPLDMLDERLLDSDPRRDGYAQKLRAFFVNKKTRRFFVPLSNWKNKSVLVIEAAIRNALSGIPIYSIILRNPQSPFISSLSRTFGMVGKTAVWTVLFVICGLFIPAFFENFLSDRAYRLPGSHRNIRRGKTPIAVSLFLAAVFIASGMADGITGVSWLAFIVIPFALFLLGWTLPAWFRWKAAKRRGHILFRPIWATKPRSERARPPIAIVCLLAVGAAACAASFFTGLGSGSGMAVFSNEGYGGLVSEEEYRAHSRRQAAFAYLPLGVDREEDTPPYRRYTEDADGLYVAAGTVEIEESVIPAYPFDSLAAFIEGAPVAAAPLPHTASGLPDGVLPFLIALAALFPFAILRRSEIGLRTPASSAAGRD